MKKLKTVVMLANPRGSGSMSSMGNASYMLIRQFQFPFKYKEIEKIIGQDSDQSISFDYNHAKSCLKRHTGGFEGFLEIWFSKANDTEIISFIKEFIKADKSINWTGYRILGSVDPRGYPVWTLDLFSKNPKSNTKVYSNFDAPNVKKNFKVSNFKHPFPL